MSRRLAIPAMVTLVVVVALGAALIPRLAHVNWHAFFFLLFGGAASLFALAVVFSTNVVRMAFYLVISLSATSGLFFLAGADFAGAMQLMIYVGGTLVLLIFGVMLTAQAQFVSMKTLGHEWVLAALVGGSLLVVLIMASVNIVAPDHRAASVPPDQTVTVSRLALGLLGARPDRGSADPEMARGMSGYLLPFEIVSVHLLVVLIGAAYLARTKRRRSQRMEFL